MPLVIKDRVMETTSSTGTGTITLNGAVAGYQSFSVIGNGNTTYYAIVGGSEWEVGLGTYTSSGTTLSRDTVLESSSSGAKVSFSAGTKNVFVTYPAERAVLTDDIGVTVQAYDAQLADIAGLNPTSDGFIVGNGTNFIIETGATARSSLGLGTLATQNGTFSGTSSGTNTGDQNLFSTIAVSGQSNVVADSTSDTLTLVAGTNITITTDATSDSVTINAVGSLPSGTRLAFQQTSAPTGWTKDTTAALNDSIMRIVTGTASSGGSTAFTTFNGQTTVGATTLSTSQMPSHQHSPIIGGGTSVSYGATVRFNNAGNTWSNNAQSANTGTNQIEFTGGGTSHNHTITTSIKYYDFIIASKD